MTYDYNVFLGNMYRKTEFLSSLNDTSCRDWHKEKGYTGVLDLLLRITKVLLINFDYSEELSCSPVGGHTNRIFSFSKNS